MPSNFKHVTHVGWSPTSGFDLSGEEETLKPFLVKAGVDDRLVSSRSTYLPPLTLCFCLHRYALSLESWFDFDSIICMIDFSLSFSRSAWRFQLKDRETREFIYDFIQSNRVLDTMKSEQSGGRKQKPPAPPPVPIRSNQEQQAVRFGQIGG